MTDIIIKIIAGTISTFGFAVIFRLKPSQWAFATIDGLVACVAYFFFQEIIGDVFWTNALAAFLVAVFAEIFARVCKAPTTVFVFPGCIALVPGGSLYYSMSNLLSENYSEAFEFLLIAAEVGIAIGAGVIMASVLRLATFKLIGKIKKDKGVCS